MSVVRLVSQTGLETVPSIIALFEECLERARKGEIIGAAIMTIDPQRGINHYFESGTAGATVLAGGCSRLMHVVNAAWDENHD